MFRIRAGGTREQRRRLFRIAAGQHAYPQLIEHSRVIRCPLRYIGQHLIGFRHATGRRFRLGSLQNSDDGRLVERRGSSGIHRRIV
jgi:hypothetical protein